MLRGSVTRVPALRQGGRYPSTGVVPIAPWRPPLPAANAMSGAHPRVPASVSFGGKSFKYSLNRALVMIFCFASMSNTAE